MMPIVSHTQIPIPTQVSFVATPMPGTSALHALPDAVAPSVPDASVAPDKHGNNAATPAQASQAVPPSSPSGVSSVVIPASFSDSLASLGSGAIFAAQLLSQDAEGSGEFLAAYEAMVAASGVKYKPSDAGVPSPQAGNLFAKLLAESQPQQAAAVKVASLPNVPKEVASQVVVQVPAPRAEPVRGRAHQSPAQVAMLQHASTVYQSASVRNKNELGDVEPVEAANPT